MIGIIKKNKHYTYTILMAVSSSISLLKALAFAAIVKPSVFGAYSIFLLLGMMNLFLCGASLDVTLLKHCCKYEEKNIKNSAELSFSTMYFSGIFLLPVFLGVGVAEYYFLENILAVPKAVYVIAALYGWSQLMMNMLLSRTRSLKANEAFALALLVKNILIVMSGYFFVRTLGIGLFNADIFGCFVIIVAMTVFYKPSARQIITSKCLYFYKSGIVLSSSYLIRFFNKSVFDFLALFFFGAAVYGKYSFLTINFSGLMVLINIASQLLLPRWIRLYSGVGKNKRGAVLADIYALLKRTSVPLMVILCFMCIGFYIFASMWYKQYHLGFWNYATYYVGLFFIGLTVIENYFIVVEEPVNFFFISVLSLIISCLLLTVCHYVSGTITGIVLAFLCSRVLTFVITFVRIVSKSKTINQHSEVYT